MNREIKFRAFNKEKKVMFLWNLSMGFKGTDKLWSDVMQFTGLKDKNGTEIYEGDILYFVMHEKIIDGIIKKDTHYITAPVIYHSGGFFTHKDDDVCIGLWIDDTVEVVGNIYENPELLE